MPSQPPIAHPANCAGDFYVEQGCCITCGVPLDEAPGTFAWAEVAGDRSCVVVRQPQTPTEIYQTLSAMHSAEVDCIRYRGNDPAISRRIAEMGYAASCDLAPPADAKLLIRSHASFWPAGSAVTEGASQWAAAFRHYFLQHVSAYSDIGAKAVSWDRKQATARISWHQGIYHAVEFNRLADGSGILVTLPGLERQGADIGLSRFVEKWFRTDGRFQDIRWFSAEQWQAGGPHSPTVI